MMVDSTLDDWFAALNIADDVIWGTLGATWML